MEWWDGIGGEMELGRQRQAIQGKPRGSGAQKQTTSAGAAKLRTAADKKLEENSEQIAQSLLNSLLKGNATCAKLLIALADGEIDCEDEVVMRRVYSLAEELAAEPQWTGEVIEGDEESGLGDGDPEG